MPYEYDVAVIGGGPGGYSCAIRAAQLGAKVCLIEKNGLGGTCTQRGCIPTKFLHSIGDLMRRVSHAKRNGLSSNIALDYKLLKSRMEATVAKLAAGISLLLKSNGIITIEGMAEIISNKKIRVDQQKIIDTKTIVIATGSYPICLPAHTFGNEILSTSTALQLDHLPESITIIGGGYSGCEFAAILNALGSKVTLIEEQMHLLPLQIEEIGNSIGKYLQIDGVRVITGSRVSSITTNGNRTDGGREVCSIFLKDGKGDEQLRSEKVLVSIGRRPNVNIQELTRIGVFTEKNTIHVNEKMMTSARDIYAVGDVTGTYELAHVASKQGEIAAQNIMGFESKMDYSCIPACVFTYPEIAFVGDLSSDTGRSGEFPLAASAKANCLGETRGYVKVFEKSGKIIGVIVIGPHAGEVIGEATLAIKMGLNVSDVADTIHAHPTLPESFLDATRDITNEAIHLSKRNVKSTP